MHYYYIQDGWKYCAHDKELKHDKPKWKTWLLCMQANQTVLVNDVWSTIIASNHLALDLKPLFETSTTHKEQQTLIERLYALPRYQQRAVLRRWPRLAYVYDIAMDLYQREEQYARMINKRYNLNSVPSVIFFDQFVEILNQVGCMNKET
jgi:hypothetical protein